MTATTVETHCEMQRPRLLCRYHHSPGPNRKVRSCLHHVNIAYSRGRLAKRLIELVRFILEETQDLLHHKQSALLRGQEDVTEKTKVTAEHVNITA